MEFYFRGINAIRLDAKGRFAIPSKYRSCFANTLVLTMDLTDSCLLLYTAKEFEVVSEKIIQLSSMNAHTKQLKRRFLGLACDCDLDGQFRALIPPTLREYCGIEKEMVMIGQGNKFEIWSKAHWEKERQEWKKNNLNYSDTLTNLSI